MTSCYSLVAKSPTLYHTCLRVVIARHCLVCPELADRGPMGLWVAVNRPKLRPRGASLHSAARPAKSYKYTNKIVMSKWETGSAPPSTNQPVEFIYRLA
jgi:hypothetical protein